MSELGDASGSKTGPGWWLFLGGVGLATLGHALAIVAMKFRLDMYGARSPDEDLDAGGRGAILYPALGAFSFAHMLLFSAGLLFIASR